MDPLLGNFRTDSEILHSLELDDKMYSTIYKNVNKHITCLEKRVSDIYDEPGIEATIKK